MEKGAGAVAVAVAGVEKDIMTLENEEMILAMFVSFLQMKRAIGKIQRKRSGFLE